MEKTFTGEIGHGIIMICRLGDQKIESLASLKNLNLFFFFFLIRSRKRIMIKKLFI